MLESALEAGFASAGVDVLLTGPLPTPGVAYLTRALRLGLGVVISASHNPFDDNGIKFFSARGEKLPDAWEPRSRRRSTADQRWVGSAELGRARRLDDASGRYIEFCKSTFRSELSLKGLRIVVDAAHGAGYHVAPASSTSSAPRSTAIGCKPDGFNINAGFGATAPACAGRGGARRRRRFRHRARRRCRPRADRRCAGRLYNGDELLYVMAIDRRAGQARAGRRRHADDQPRRRAGACARAASTSCARRSATATCSRSCWSAAGCWAAKTRATHRARQAHHRRRHRQRLGGAAAARPPGRTLAELLAGVRLHAQTLINVPPPARLDWHASTALAATREVERELGSAGRVLMRPSGTEPVLRVMVEAVDAGSRSGAPNRSAAIAERDDGLMTGA